MVEIMFSSLTAMLTSPHMMGLMLLAVAIGLVVGVTPGIGGRLSIALAMIGGTNGRSHRAAALVTSGIVGISEEP